MAGSDADGQTFQVMGFALHDEMQIMRDAGLSNLAVLRSATSSPAKALGLTEEFGRIAVGHRADLVLLEENPMTDVSAYRNNVGVMVRGAWIERNVFNSALEKLAQIYATESMRKAVDLDEANALIKNARNLIEGGYIFLNQSLQTLRQQCAAPTSARLNARFFRSVAIPLQARVKLLFNDASRLIGVICACHQTNQFQ